MSQPQTGRQYQPGPYPGDQRRADPQGFGSRGTNSPLYQNYNQPPSRYPGPGGSGGGRRPPRSRGRLYATIGAAAVAGTALGLGGAALFGGFFTSTGTTSTVAAAAPTHTVTQIATTIGCTMSGQEQNSQYQQATCVTTGGNRYTILTFDTDAHMKGWQAEAAGYGGADLVGTRWLVVANNRNTLDPLVSKLGGVVVVDQHG